MKRIENYRKGDRAEKLGVVLLQAICAVAEVPRQEDFGLMDAVATLLRREGGCLYAEDSFLVQIKSRTERQIEYLGSKLEALLRQDLPLMLAQVDLTRSSVELHTLGIALAHPNINDAKGLVVHLQADESCAFCLDDDDVLHVPLRKPILQWTTGDTENRVFTDLAYAVLKAWLSIERWNRRYRRAGMAQQIRWETNVVPTEGGISQTYNPARSRDALGEIAPMARVLAFYATEHPELRPPTLAILSWMRTSGIEADPGGILGLTLQSSDAQDRLKKALDRNPGVDVATTFWIIEVRPDFLAFWLFSRDSNGIGGGSRYAGSPQSLHEQGFEAKVEIVGDEVSVTVGLSDSWLDKHHLVEATPTEAVNTSGLEQGATQVFLLRRKVLQGE